MGVIFGLLGDLILKSGDVYKRQLYDCTILISSHMLSEIELIADDIGILNSESMRRSIKDGYVGLVNMIVVSMTL